MKRKRLIICMAALMILSWGAMAERTDAAQVDLLAVDHRLYELGYRDAACNGVLDDVTVNALKNFQIVNGLEPTGEPNTLTVDVLLGTNAINLETYLSELAQKNATQIPLEDGSYGNPVNQLQKELKTLGYFSGHSDGVYGEATKAAVCRFQLANGLEISGVADGAVQLRIYSDSPVSWEDFIRSSVVRAGDSGVAVRRAQLCLRQKGYFSGECTGRYGDGTQQAVQRFQQDNSLESSGDLDRASCEKLYWDADVFLQDANVLRRGDTGADAEQLCRNLALLGYPAHGRFNMQTELALMQFQLANGLPVSGEADAQTQQSLKSAHAVSAANYSIPSQIEKEDGLNQKMSRQAYALLGQYSELDNSFGFVQYVALKCGAELMRQDQLSRTQVGKADHVESGALLGVIVEDREILGIAASDNALIYRADNGYIVMSYLDTMEPQSISIYTFD